jgi:gamma-glutamyl-gamma-aminobutyrate hydrolase PuuD
MQRASELGIPIVGVCRGAQMLCAHAGGFLIQDVRGHATGHPHTATTDEGIEIVVNSYHHQMLYPFEVEHEMWAECKDALSPYHLDVDTDIPVPTETEMVYFPKVKGFAVQWHPEWMDDDCNATQFMINKINAYL